MIEGMPFGKVGRKGRACGIVALAHALRPLVGIMGEGEVDVPEAEPPGRSKLAGAPVRNRT